jgi:hypothetical protein
MNQQPTLAETLAVRPEQLTGLTPVEVDRYNMVLSDEYRRLDEAIDKACDRLYSALLLSKESVRRGRGHARVWPISLTEAEKRAAEHLETGYEPEQRARLQHGLMRDGAYAEQLRAAVDRLAALRAEWKALNEGPTAVLDGEFDRRGGWTRMFLCTTDGGHIHTGRQCPSIGPRTPLSWLPQVSGMDWREAYKLVIRDMTAGTEAIMCSKKTCFPDAPVEWTQRQAPETECPGSRQYAKLMDPGMANRVYRWAECHVCHAPRVTVTSGGNLRKHDRPEGGEETAPEAPAPQAPAADKPRDDNRLTIIERTPLQAPPAAEEKPAETAPAPKLTAAQQGALDLMRSRHDGMINTGEGFAVTTVDVLARHGLCTVEKSHRADGILRSARHPYFEATLTDKGWEGYERPAEPGPAYGEPTPNEELAEGDRVINVHTGTEGVWQGSSQLGGWSVRMDHGGTANIFSNDGDHWRLVERAAVAPVAEPEEEPQAAPASAAHAYDSKGRSWQVGQRAEFKTNDMFLYAGEIVGFGEKGGEKIATIRVDTRRGAPASRPVYKGAPNLPGKPWPVDPPEDWDSSLTKLKRPTKES